MKILFHVPDAGGRGGLETVLKTLLNSDFSSDNQIIFQTEKMIYTDWLREFPKRVVQKHITSPKKSRRILGLYSTLKEHPDIDCIIETGGGQFLQLDYYLRRLLNRRFKIISWYHVSLAGVHLNSHADKFKYADAYLAISSGIRDQLVNSGISEDKISLIYNPIPHNNQLKLSKGKQVIFSYVGRLDEIQKNLKEMFSGFEGIPTNQYVLNIYGSNPVESEWNQQKQCAKEKGINVNWYGWQDRPWESVSNNGTDYLIMTSNYEGFPMVLLEALSRGIPVISSDCISGPRDIVNDKNGYLYNLHDIEQLNSVISEAIKNSGNWDQSYIQSSINQCYYSNYIDNLNLFLKKITSTK